MPRWNLDTQQNCRNLSAVGASNSPKRRAPSSSQPVLRTPRPHCATPKSVERQTIEPMGTTVGRVRRQEAAARWLVVRHRGSYHGDEPASPPRNSCVISSSGPSLCSVAIKNHIFRKFAPFDAVLCAFQRCVSGPLSTFTAKLLRFKVLVKVLVSK